MRHVPKINELLGNTGRLMNRSAPPHGSLQLEVTNRLNRCRQIGKQRNLYSWETKVTLCKQWASNDQTSSPMLFCLGIRLRKPTMLSSHLQKLKFLNISPHSKARQNLKRQHWEVDRWLLKKPTTTTFCRLVGMYFWGCILAICSALKCATAYMNERKAFCFTGPTKVKGLFECWGCHGQVIRMLTMGVRR